MLKSWLILKYVWACVKKINLSLTELILTNFRIDECDALVKWKKRHFINRFSDCEPIEVFLQIIDRVNPRHTSNIFGILSADRCALSRQIIKLQTINQFLLIAETLILKLKRWRSTTALIITVKKKTSKGS